MSQTVRPDRFDLAELSVVHPIGTDFFIPFLIVRLGGLDGIVRAELCVELRDIGSEGSSKRRLELCWSEEMVPAQPLAIPEREVTEWAACAIASIVTHVYGHLQVCAVTGDGDRFDYWVSDGHRQAGLEVSGTKSQDLEGRHRVKSGQVLDNLFGVDRYVVVVDFGARHAIFSFHKNEKVGP